MKVGIILTPDNRSKAYLQKIIRNKIVIDEIILLDDGRKITCTTEEEECAKIFEFNLSKSVKEILDDHKLKYKQFSFVDINNVELIEYLKTLYLDFCIFSGGGILKKEILGLSTKFVHFHPGIVPNYRGSTCFYYSILNDDECGVTAFIMEEGLDVGDVICKKNFKKPNHIYVDSVYDPHIRSETLVEVLKKNLLSNNFEKQESEGETYYIIHPILKHIAILSCE